MPHVILTRSEQVIWGTVNDFELPARRALAACQSRFDREYEELVKVAARAAIAYRDGNMTAFAGLLDELQAAQQAVAAREN